jgi:serine/threonine protein kinase
MRRIAPEMFSSAGYDDRVDIWALGIVGIECATGHPPYYKKSAQDVWRIICKDTRGPTLESNAECDGQYDRYGDEFRHCLSIMLRTSASDRPTATHILQSAFVTNLAQDKRFVVEQLVLKLPFECVEQSIDIDWQNDDAKDRAQTMTIERGHGNDKTLLENIRNFFR